jgi:hypothetical protein
MKQVISALIPFLLLVPVSAIADSTGTWTGTFTVPGNDPQALVLILNEGGGRVTGTAGNSKEDQKPISNGTVQNGTLHLEIVALEGATLILDLTQNGDELTGTMQLRIGPDTLGGTASLKRGG